MSKGKTVSKNNAATREAAVSFFYDGKKVKPVMLVSGGAKSLMAEYENGNLVTSANGSALPWQYVRSHSTNSAN